MLVQSWPQIQLPVGSVGKIGAHLDSSHFASDSATTGGHLKEESLRS